MRGATMAVNTLIGFFAATLSPLVFGAVQDIGGDTRVLSRGLAFAVLGVPAGPLVLWLLRPSGGAKISEFVRVIAIVAPVDQNLITRTGY